MNEYRHRNHFDKRLDRAVAGDLVADLGAELGDLIPEVVQIQRVCGYQGAAVLDYSFDLGASGS